MTKEAAPRALMFSIILGALATPAAYAVDTCDVTVNDCSTTDNQTSSHIQIGGPGSLSSNDDCGGADCNDPGKLGNGTIADARMDFTLDRAAATLTVTLDNTTDTVASLTAIYFQAPAAVTGMSLASVAKTCPPDDLACTPLPDWEVQLDPANLNAAGFGRFDVYIGNAPDTGPGGGNPIELLAGETLTVVIDLTGDLSAVTACSFTSEGSKIPPGDKVVTGIGRFQSGANNGDSGWIGPCTGGDLYVELKFFRPDPRNGRVILNWETATELDNLGFNVLRKGEIGPGGWEIVNAALIPAQGDPLAGAGYTLEDLSVVNGVRYRYRLEDLDLAGFNTLHPVELSVPNPQQPPIKLSLPAYGHSFLAAEAMRLRWETTVRGPLRVQFSADPSFPVASRVEFPARGRRRGDVQEMGLNPHEQMLVRAVQAAGVEGQIYWRVVEAPRGDRQGRVSDVFRFGGE